MARVRQSPGGWGGFLTRGYGRILSKGSLGWDRWDGGCGGSGFLRQTRQLIRTAQLPLVSWS